MLVRPSTSIPTLAKTVSRADRVSASVDRVMRRAGGDRNNALAEHARSEEIGTA